jgi:methylenetetrahydrofolate/methylenetetrahydromethanopterin dehydrogenase (NADP+)
MSLAKILVCLDSDVQPSVFDSVVAVDAGVDQLLRHGGVAPGDVRDLIYGAMFTRGPTDLKNTAVFIGGSDVGAGEKLLAKARECFFGPIRVSLMLDSNGANTTAAAAVVCAGKHIDLRGTTATVLAATGSVGRRVVRLLAREGVKVRLASRRLARAEKIGSEILAALPHAELQPIETSDAGSFQAAVAGAAVVISTGAPGVELLSETTLRQASDVRVAIDLNAVPPAGIGGIEPTDKAIERGGQICYGAIGAGGTKMKLHKAALRRLFEANDLVLDADEIYELGKAMS